MLVKKNIVILHPCDKCACAFYRCHAIAMMLNSDKEAKDLDLIATIAARRWLRIFFGDTIQAHF